VVKDLDKLKKMYLEYERAMNKDEIREDILTLIKSIEDKLATSKKSASFEDFDLSHKLVKRRNAHTNGKTLHIQIRD
jgi:hypothetical protein